MNRRVIFRVGIALVVSACGTRSGLEVQDGDPTAASGTNGRGGAGGTVASDSGSGARAAAAGSGGSAGSDASGADAAADHALGDAPWQGNPGPFCSGYRGAADSLDVWSDARGVFALVGIVGKESIFVNDGRGWRTLLEGVANVPSRLSGFAGGPLVKYGGAGCGVRFIDHESEVCSAAVSDVSAFHAVRPDLAFAVSSGDRLLRYDGRLWTQVGPPFPPAGTHHGRGVWAAEDRVLVVTNRGVLKRTGDTSELTADSELPPGDYRSVWGTPDGAAWSGDAASKLWQRGGSSWQLAWDGGDACRRPIRRLWAAGGSLFFVTDTAFGLHDGRVARVIHEWPCDGSITVRGLWGNSDSEVFLSVQDRARADTDCGEAVLLWYDGKRLNAL